MSEKNQPWFVPQPTPRSPTPEEELMKTRRKPYVLVTLEGPEDGGDFGPHTPGTKTSGIQEALDYAHAHCRDVFIFGGRGGVHAGTEVEPGNGNYSGYLPSGGSFR